MGSCVSSPDSVETVNQIDSSPVPVTVIPQIQPHVSIPDPEPTSINITPGHIADREGGCGQYELQYCVIIITIVQICQVWRVQCF